MMRRRACLKSPGSARSLVEQLFSAAPSLGGMVGAGPGAELGAAVGSAAAGPIGTVVGGLAGGLGGYLLGSTAVGAAQDYLISRLPKSWRDEFEEKSQAAAAEHPFGFWLGGLAPVAITGNPLSAASELPANATALERLMANPVTRRLLPAGLMGATEAFNENRAGEPVDPTRIALSTAAGLFFPVKIGSDRSFRSSGTSPFRPRVVAPNEPTVAQAGDMKVAGPGVTEQVYQGREQMSPQARGKHDKHGPGRTGGYGRPAQSRCADSRATDEPRSVRPIR